MSFARVYIRPSDGGYTRSFGINDLRDLIQVAIERRHWIAKAEKRLSDHRCLMSWIYRDHPPSRAVVPGDSHDCLGPFP